MYKYSQRPDEIYHYGIKRRSGRYPWGSGDRPYQRMSIGQKRKEAKKNITGDIRIKGLKKEEKEEKFYKDLSHDRIIEKGSVCYRISSTSKEQSDGPTFVSFDNDSALNYAGTLQSDINGKKYLTKYTLEKDVKIPSVQEMSTTLVDVLYKDAKDNKAYLTEWSDRTRKEYDKVKNIFINDPEEALIKIYTSILRSNANDVGELGDKVHEELAKKGFDGVPDLNDTSINYKTPIYLFDRKDVLKENEQMDVSKYIPGVLEEKYNVKYI